MKYSLNDLKNELTKYYHTAQDYLYDNAKIDALFNDVETWVSNVPKVGKYGKDIVELVELVKCHISKEYTVAPVSSIITIIAGLIYLVTPIDLIPDYLIGAGVLDDLAMLTIILRMIQPDLEKFRVWKENK